MPTDFDAKIIAEFRANRGRVGGTFEGTALLLLHHTGATSGRNRVTPLVYLRDGERYIVIASNGGARRSPQWYRNLRAQPNVAVEVGSRTLAVVAREATGEERARLFRAQAERFPRVPEYEKKARRTIPVIVLTPRAAA